MSLLAPRLSAGAVIVFDELINYADFEMHEMKALLELQRHTGRTLRVWGYPGPRILGDSTSLRPALESQGGELKQFAQDALVQLL